MRQVRWWRQHVAAPMRMLTHHRGGARVPRRLPCHWNATVRRTQRAPVCTAGAREPAKGTPARRYRPRRRGAALGAGAGTASRGNTKQWAMKRATLRQRAPYAVVWEVERLLWPHQPEGSWDPVPTHLLPSTRSDPHRYAAAVEAFVTALEAVPGLNFVRPPRLPSPQHALALTATLGRDGSLALARPQVVPSCRMYRRWGWHRFLRVRHEAVRNVRHVQRLLVAGRQWDLLCTEPEDRIVVYFASKGKPLEPSVNVAAVRQWHFPLPEPQSLSPSPPPAAAAAAAPLSHKDKLAANARQSVAKYNARFWLGFSSSVPSLTLLPGGEHVVHDVDDVCAVDTGAVLNDGCNGAHPRLLDAVCAAAGLTHTASAIQGRLGAAKGVWYADASVTGLRRGRSQVKYEVVADPPDQHQHTLEVCRVATDRGPAALNRQFIQVLEHRGVPVATFVQLLREAADHVAQSYVGSAENARRTLRLRLRRHGHGRQSTGGPSNQRLSTAESGGRNKTTHERHSGNASTRGGKRTPGSGSGVAMDETSTGLPPLEEQAMAMLTAGFDLSNPFLWHLCSSLARFELAKIRSKAKLVVPSSRWLLMIADPSGTLEPHQAFVQLSGNGGGASGCIVGDMVLARNPCHLPSDVRRFEGIDVPALRYLTDIVVLSTKGSMAPAQHLSGGDYDGDEVWVCWDQRLLPRHSSNEDAWSLSRHQLQQRAEQHVTRDTLCMQDVLQGRSNRMTGDTIATSSSSRSSSESNTATSDKDNNVAGEEHDAISHALADAFVRYQPTLGVLTNLHAAWAEHAGIASPEALLLATLAAMAVDAPKSGTHVRVPKELTKVPLPEWADVANHGGDAKKKAGPSPSNHSSQPQPQGGDGGGGDWDATCSPSALTALHRAAQKLSWQHVLQPYASTGPLARQPDQLHIDEDLLVPGRHEFASEALSALRTYRRQLAAALATAQPEQAARRVLRQHRVDFSHNTPAHMLPVKASAWYEAAMLWERRHAAEAGSSARGDGTAASVPRARTKPAVPPLGQAILGALDEDHVGMGPGFDAVHEVDPTAVSAATPPASAAVAVASLSAAVQFPYQVAFDWLLRLKADAVERRVGNRPIAMTTPSHVFRAVV